MAPVAPKGMTERDRPSVYVHFLRVQIQVAHYLQRDDGECLVYPPQVDVPRRHARLIQRFDRGRRRRGQHYNGLRALALPPAQCMSAGPRRTGSYIFEDEQSATYKIVEEAPNGPHIRLPSGKAPDRDPAPSAKRSSPGLEVQAKAKLECEGTTHWRAEPRTVQ